MLSMQARMRSASEGWLKRECRAEGGRGGGWVVGEVVVEVVVGEEEGEVFSMLHFRSLFMFGSMVVGGVSWGWRSGKRVSWCVFGSFFWSVGDSQWIRKSD